MLPLLFLSGLSVPDHQPSWDLFLPLGCQLLMFGSGALSSNFSYLPLSSVFMLSFLCPFSRFVYTSRQLNVILCIFSRLDIDEIMEGGLELDEVDGVRDMLTTKAVPFTQDHFFSRTIQWPPVPCEWHPCPQEDRNVSSLD